MTRKRGIKQLINYILKERNIEPIEEKPLTIKHNLNGTDKDRWIKQLEFNETLRKYKRKDQIAIYHEVLSFSNLDKNQISRKMLKDIAKKYIELRGIDSMYLIRQHSDKDHIHLHVAMSGTKFLTGKANRISKADFEKFRVQIEAYQNQKYPELKNSLVYGKNKIKRESKKHIRQNNRNEIEDTLRILMQNSNSTKDLAEQLKTKGHEVYYRGGKMTGVNYKGEMKFRFSKLGFDKDCLDELDKEELSSSKQMEELENLRNGSKDQEKESDYRIRSEINTSEDEPETMEYDEDYER